MPTYTLSYEDDGKGVERKIRFEASDAARALTIAQSIKPGRSGTLWEGDRRLCRLERRMLGSASDVWVVRPALRTAAAEPLGGPAHRPGGASGG